MGDVARKVRLTIGKDVVGNMDGAGAILKISRHRFAPDKVDCIFQEIHKFTNFKRATQDMDTCLLGFEMLEFDLIWALVSLMNPYRPFA